MTRELFIKMQAAQKTRPPAEGRGRVNESLDAPESVYARSRWQINAKRARARENGDREVIRGSTRKKGGGEEKCDGAIVRRVGSERGGREDVERRDRTKATSSKGREGGGEEEMSSMERRKKKMKLEMMGGEGVGMERAGK